MMRLFSAVVFLVGSSLGSPDLSAQAGDVPLAFRNVTVVDVREGMILADMTVVISGDRITAVGAVEEVDVPAGARVVDGTGRFLIPGLWDMHTHSWGEAILRDIFLPLYVAHGVTGIREMTGDPYELEARAEVAAGTLLGPRMLVSSPIVDGPNPMSPGRHRPRVADADQARRTVDALKARGYDLIQTHQFLSPAAYRALHERAREVGMEVSGTIPISVSLWEAAALGHRTVEHLWGVELACSSREEELRVDYRRRVEEISADTSLRTHVAVWNRTELEPLLSIDPEKCQALYRHLAANETWVVPTLLIQRLMAYPTDAALQNDPRQRYLPGPGWALEEYADFYDPEQRLRATYEHRLRTLVDLQRAGVGILAAGEVPAGFSLHDELALYVESGLTPLEALRTATLNPARYLGATESLGTVEAGKIADLVLLDANPLEDISNVQRIAGVILNGRYFDRDALDAMLADVERAAKLSGSPAEPDTVRFTIIVDGHRKAERRVWQEAADTWRYEYEGDSYDSYHFPRSERLVLDPDGLPVRMEITGEKSPWSAWQERFERESGVVRWTTTIDEGESTVEGPAYYVALHPVHDIGGLVRALLRQPSGRLPLLPAGEARIESLGERTIATEEGTRTVRHYAVHGLDLKPTYVWLDESGATFADEWSVLSGWEAAFGGLRAATEAALAEYHRGLARNLVPPARERPLAITGARLFDPETHAVRAGTTILIDGNRIAAVGADGSVDVPPGAEMIEAAGRMVLPGLWDMHAHHGIPSVYLELDAPLHLAGGITTARDLGSHTAPILSLKERIEAGEAIGPRLLLAGFIEGAGGRPSGVLVGSTAEAEAAVDRFAELGFVQIKIYEQVPGELVPVIIERAAHHGLRVSGHITHSMSGREAVEAGYDELQHIGDIMLGILGSWDGQSEYWQDNWSGWVEALAGLQPGSETVREFIDLLVARGVAIDPTLAGTEASEVPPDFIAPVLDRLPAQARRRILDQFWNPPPEMIAHLDRIVSSRRGFIRVAHEAGIPVLPGTDIIPGFGYHRELELYVEAGIPAPEVLTLATLGAARVMGMDDELGSIEPGKLADLILVDGDPTTDISDIRRVVMVIKDGRVYDPAAIYRALGVEP